MKLQPDRVNELFMETIGVDVENESSELSKSTEEEIHVYDDRDAFIKESCEDELELGLTVSFCEEQETAKERTDDDHKHSSEEEKTKESQSQNTPDVIDITEDENQEPDRESLTCTQNDVKVLSNGNEDTPKLRSEHDEENSSKKGGESDDGNKDNKEDHISVVEDGSNSTSEESDRLLFADTLLVYLQKRKEKGRIRYKWDGQIGGLKDFVSLILKKEGRWKSKTNKGGGAIHTFQEKASEFNLTFWTSSRTLSVQANDGNKEKLLDKFERLMIRTSPEEVTQADFAKHRPDKKMVKEIVLTIWESPLNYIEKINQ